MKNQEQKKEEELEVEGEKKMSAENKKIEKKFIFMSRKRLLIIFVIGLLTGIALKGNIMKKYIVGFEDYKLKQLKSDYDFSLPEPKVVGEQDEATVEPAQE